MSFQGYPRLRVLTQSLFDQYIVVLFLLLPNAILSYFTHCFFVLTGILMWRLPSSLPHGKTGIQKIRFKVVSYNEGRDEKILPKKDCWCFPATESSSQEKISGCTVDVVYSRCMVVQAKKLYRCYYPLDCFWFVKTICLLSCRESCWYM